MKEKEKALKMRKDIAPREALEILKEGNYRFLNNLKINRNLLQQVNETSDGQWPFAAILSCMDSRTSAELIFDQGLGDIFSIRIAGNIVNADILGSLEYACKVAGSRIIVVLGHTKCGAIRGACDHLEMGNLTALLSKIQPAVFREHSVTENRTSSNPGFVMAVTRLNVQRTVRQILEESIILRELIESGRVGIVGALYDVETGEVGFMEETMIVEPKPLHTLSKLEEGSFS